MMYEDAAVRLRMKADVRAFLESATRDRNTPPPDPGEARTALAARAAFDGLPPTRREVVTTHHSIAFRGRELAYTARAGTLPIADTETAEVHANVFFVAYTVAPAPAGTQRPLLFAWNGGPGSNAGLLHVAAMGPRRLGMGDVFATADPAEMRAMVDNEATWLGATDLVFVDPVGTGYSRPTRAEYGAEFYDTVGDVESLAEFIRVYRTRFDAWDAPLFLAGESYGSLRAAAVARSLQRKGIDVRGIIFISGSPGLGSVPDTPNAALVLPSYTATALYHGRLSPERSADPEQTLGEARRWAQGPYADALLRRDSLTPAERSSLAAELSSFSGLPASLFEDSNLAVSGAAFSEHLLEDAGRILGRYDARLSRPRKPDEGIFDPREDASLAPLENTVSGNAPTMIRYLRYELGYQSDLFYMGPFGGAWPPPERFRADWMSVRWNRSEGPSAPLLEVLAGNPDLRVLHASGTYDLVTPAGPPAYQIDRLPPDLRDRFTVRVYEGGHSFYFDRDCRMRFMEDGTRLIEAASRR